MGRAPARGEQAHGQKDPNAERAALRSVLAQITTDREKRPAGLRRTLGDSEEQFQRDGK